MKVPFPYCLVALMSFSTLVLGQSKPRPLPCDLSEKLLRDHDGKLLWFTSDQMKKRATHRVDIGPVLKQADIKDTAIVDIIVNPSGTVACVKSLIGLPMVRLEVEKALRGWMFTSASMEGKPVAYVGEIEFSLCNLSCGEEGPSMTLLK
jgi:hypothetical protein